MLVYVEKMLFGEACCDVSCDVKLQYLLNQANLVPIECMKLWFLHHFDNPIATFTYLTNCLPNVFFVSCNTCSDNSTVLWLCQTSSGQGIEYLNNKLYHCRRHMYMTVHCSCDRNYMYCTCSCDGTTLHVLGDILFFIRSSG